MSNVEKENLLGLTIDEATEKLGYWWVLESVGFCYFRFHRAPNKYIGLKTDSDNIVTSVWYN